MTVDDAQWADEASLRFLSHLGRRINDLPVLLVLVSRSPAGAEDGVGRALTGIQASTLHLAPLGDDAVIELIRDAYSDEADDAFCRACAKVSGGNPFFLVETLASLRAEGVEPTAAQTHRVASLRPEMITRTIQRRLDRLGPEAVRVARAVAVLGPAAELRRVARLAGLDQRRVAELVNALTHEAITTNTRPIEFAHPLVRGAVEDGAGDVVRAVAHRRAASIMADDGAPPEQIALHLLLAEPAADTWVVSTLRSAALDALAVGAPAPAATYLQRALHEPPVPEVHGDVYLELGRSLAMLNRPDDAAAAFRTALTLVDSRRARGQVALELGTMQLHAGRGRDAHETFRRMAPIHNHGDHALARRQLLGTILSKIISIEPPHAWICDLDLVVPELSANDDTARILRAALAFGGAVTGDRPYLEVAHLATRAADGELSAPTASILVSLASVALAIADQKTAAIELLDRAIQAARAAGDQAAFGHLTLIRSRTVLTAGRVVEAEGDARAALDIFHDRPLDAAAAVAVLIPALLERDDIAGAETLLSVYASAQQHAADGPMTQLIPIARARLRMRQGRPADALTDFLACGKVLVAAGYTNPGFAHWRSGAALAHLALGQRPAARELIQKDLEHAHRFQAPHAIGEATRVAGLIEGGPTGLTLLRESVAVLETSTAELERARALTDYGAALRRAGQRRAAQEPLRRGLDLATRCCADALARRAHAELIAAGARPRRPTTTGPAALTAAEVRVARMAAEGMTNRDVAQALFLTKRTIEVHLTNTYRKLGITSREQLAETLQGQRSGTKQQG